jgi:hypothetical protein
MPPGWIVRAATPRAHPLRRRLRLFASPDEPARVEPANRLPCGTGMCVACVVGTVRRVGVLLRVPCGTGRSRWWPGRGFAAG